MENILVLPQRKISLFIQVTGFIFFGILFYFCWQFYLERMLSFDGAFYVFRFMQSNELFSSPGRYGDYIPEAFAFMAYKFNWTLPTILRVYSVIFILLHYVIFLFITIVLRNNGAGIAVMLVSCLAYYYAFYLPTVQLHESLVLGILLWALIHPEYGYTTLKEKNLALAGALATILYMSYLHPLGIFIVAFVFGVEMIGARRYRDKYLWYVILPGMTWVLLKFYVISKQGYDQDQLMPLGSMFNHLSSWKTWPSTQYVDNLTWLHFRTLKFLGLLLLLLSLRKGLLFFLFLLSYVVGFTFIFLANYQHGASASAYECYYIIYGFFAGLIFVFLLYHPRRKNLILFLALPLIWISVKKIYQAHAIYTDRLSYIGRIVKQAHQDGDKKYIIDSRCYPYDYAMTPWNVAFETLLYSSLQGPDSTVTVFVKEPALAKLCDSLQNKQNILFGAYFSVLWFTSNDMPQSYFHLPATGYKYLTHTQDDSSFHEELFSAQNIKIVPLQQTIHVNVNDLICAIPVEVINSSGHIIPAIPRSKNPVLLSFKFLDQSGKLWFDDASNAFETDVKTMSTCAITFPIPRKKGVFFLKPRIITKGLRDWNIPAQPVKIIID